jgi:hypothetical protein
MTRFAIVCLAAVCASYCSYDTVDTGDTVATGTAEQDVSQMQGSQIQGTSLLGSDAQNMTMQGFQYTAATLNDAALDNLHIENGELVAQQGQATLRGTALAEAHLLAQLHDTTVTPPTSLTVEYRITAIAAEDATYDPTGTGHTYLYTLEQNVDGIGTWQTACPADQDGRHVAIPVAAIWDDHGNRVESTTLFTFGCTTGVVAKCYRWGYRPWLTGYGDVVAAHWTCTRAARADYCGNGTPHTRDGTTINVWDNLAGSGPIQSHGTTPMGMLFEAGWDTGGAVCFSHARWLLDGPLIALICPGRLVAPGLGILGATVCDTVPQVLGQAADAVLFDESNLNLNLDLF